MNAKEVADKLLEHPEAGVQVALPAAEPPAEISSVDYDEKKDVFTIVTK